MKQACAAVLWMFCPPGLRAGHVTESYELAEVPTFWRVHTTAYLVLGTQFGGTKLAPASE